MLRFVSKYLSAKANPAPTGICPPTFRDHHKNGAL
jgi:hypothetical protein